MRLFIIVHSGLKAGSVSTGMEGSRNQWLWRGTYQTSVSPNILITCFHVVLFAFTCPGEKFSISETQTKGRKKQWVITGMNISDVTCHADKAPCKSGSERTGCWESVACFTRHFSWFHLKLLSRVSAFQPFFPILHMTQLVRFSLA